MLYCFITFFFFYVLYLFIFFFFFSSRRRHTRWPRDWSSDVCSSDLSTNARRKCRRDSTRSASSTFIASRTAKPTPLPTRPSTRPKASRPIRPRQSPNLRRGPCRGASPRVFAAACSTFSKTLACPMARSSKFPFFRCKNANRPSVDGKPKSLLQQIGAIQRVALGGNEAGVGNDAAQLAFVGAVFHAGGEHHVLFDQDAPDVIGPELQ